MVQLIPGLRFPHFSLPRHKVFLTQQDPSHKIHSSTKSTLIFFFFLFRLCPKWFVRLIERLSIVALAAVALLYFRLIIISRGLPLSFTESDNPTLFHPDLWTRFRTYCYLCALNVRLLLCPNILCYDWSMDSISRIESWWDMRNLETLVVTLVSSCLCIYGEYANFHVSYKQNSLGHFIWLRIHLVILQV